MKEKLLSYLKCIKCNSSDLKLDSIKLENEEIVSGKIICASCQEDYLIKEGIPVMLLEDKDISFDATPEYEEMVTFLLPTKKIQKLIHQNSKGLSLDIGCGNGIYIDNFNSKVVAMDINPYFVKVARDMCDNRDSIYFVVADANKLPFRDNIFDFTFCSSVLEHFEQVNLEKILEGFERVTKPRGLIQVDTPNYSKFMEALIDFLIKIKFYELSQKTDRETKELYHHSKITVTLLKAYGYKVNGCLGQISRGRLKCDWLADLYDMIMYHIPYLAGTIIGTKKVKK
jgi:ubiquinone/menaquinone biosynthesis C-methylase UbiE/uncharacterized protein YbaR (Trm112 family)